MHIHLLHQKHERLVTLLKKLRDSFIVAINTTSSKPGGAKQIVGSETKVQSVLAVIDPSSHKIDRVGIFFVIYLILNYQLCLFYYYFPL